MMNDSSLPTTGKAFFELDTQAGVMHVLASIRASEIPTIQKNELRDLVFFYTNGGKDKSVRISLEQKIDGYKLVALPMKAPKVVLPAQPIIGKYRVAPIFKTTTPSAPVAVVAPKPVFTDAPAWKAPVDIVEPKVVPTEPVVTEVPISKPLPVAPLSVAPATAAPQPVSAAEFTAPAVPAEPDYLQRIREIKAAVNEKVGNPVNLVDINNEVGREYMGALLDAMKKLNSGSSALSAMKRLEEAYASVEVALEVHGVTEPIASAPAAPQQPTQAPTPTAAPTVYDEPIEAPVYSVPINQGPTLNLEPEETVPFTQPKTGRLPVSSLPSDDLPNVTYPVSQSAPARGAAPLSNRPPLAPVSDWVAPAPTVAPVPNRFASLAEAEQKPRTLQDVPSADSLKNSSVVGDPLFTKEVDDGLDQLLSEWSIFKKSGLFGTGPKGREHPLFKKIAPLHIPLLLAGRFEGATQEIKQSVTDYMNGWRYEQGLIYQQGETFEHYLRRVIRHILDLQKGK
jgi:hypothetical protein